MSDNARDQGRVSRWALPASVAAHLLAVALLIFGLPRALPEPQPEQAIKVDLVQPPKPEARAAPKPEAKAASKTLPSPKKEEKLQPAPAAKPQPDPAEKPREAKAEKRQDVRPEKPKDVQPEKPKDVQEQKPPPANKETASPETFPTLVPVIQYGEKDAGPSKSPDGKSAEDASSSTAALNDPDKEKLAAPPVLTDAKAETGIAPPGAPETPARKPTVSLKDPHDAKNAKTKTVFSQAATGSPVATTAMGDVPRGVRASRLCVTELRDRLQSASPPYFPELLPSYPLREGNVLDVPQAAFRMSGQWFDLRYHCEVDAGATKVVSFAFQVGGPIPPSEWKGRGLPSR